MSIKPAAAQSPAELAEFARQVYLAPSKTYPTAASYQYAIEKGADHPYAVETLASLRVPGFTMPSFSRPVPKEYAWNDPDNPEHSPELRADIEEMGRLWRNREASWRDQPWPVENQLTPRALWRRLFRLRNRYHSLEDTLQFEANYWSRKTRISRRMRNGSVEPWSLQLVIRITKLDCGRSGR